MTKGGKHCVKRRNYSFWAISSFVTMFSKIRLLQRRRKASIWGFSSTALYITLFQCNYEQFLHFPQIFISSISRDWPYIYLYIFKVYRCIKMCLHVRKGNMNFQAHWCKRNWAHFQCWFFFLPIRITIGPWMRHISILSLTFTI